MVSFDPEIAAEGVGRLSIKKQVLETQSILLTLWIKAKADWPNITANIVASKPYLRSEDLNKRTIPEVVLRFH